MRNSSLPLVGTVMLAVGLLVTSVHAAPDAAINIACRPDGNSTSRVRVSWTDTNNGAADYIVQRQNVSMSGGWSNIGSVTAGSWNGDDCEFIDGSASNTTVYRYRVIADDGNDQSAPSQICREPRWLDSAGGNYRVFYRIVECPSVEGKQVCTQNVTMSGQNKHALQMAQIFEQYRTKYMSFGFNDPAVFGGNKPFPVDLFPCNNGCSNSRGIQIPPQKLEAADYDPATGIGNAFEYFIPGHEIFHKVQAVHGGSSDPFYKWVIEGQARAMEDKACVFTNPAECEIWDNDVDKFYNGQMAAYLGKPEVGLQEQSYNAAIFWVKAMEEFTSLHSEPELGTDVMVKFWQQNESNNPTKDGIDTLNDTLAKRIMTSRRFVDIFKDFVVANYAKDFITTPAPSNLAKYNYIDEETLPKGTYGKVKLTRSDPLNLGQVVFGTESVDALGARYFEVQPDLSVPVVNIEVHTLPATQNELYYHVLGIDGGGQIAYQHFDTGTSFEHSVPNIAPTLTRIALVVASLGYQTNFDYGFNQTDGLFILSPTSQFPAIVGDAASPKKFILRLEVIGKDGDPEPGIDPNDFVINVGGSQIHPAANPDDSPLIVATFIGGQYWLVVRAPANPGCDPCDLTVEYNTFTDTKTNALDYGAAPSIDNMIVIDRSGSMEGGKIAAAKEAGRLYVDAFDIGDRVGVVSYAESPDPEYPLTVWDDASRSAAQLAIESINPPDGGTASGAALREGMQQLIDQVNPNPNRAMVLLSDGKDTVLDTDDHLPEFISQYKSRKEDGDLVPIIHVVAVGDDADGVELEKLIAVSGGEFHWLSDFGAVAESFSTELAEIYRVMAEAVTEEEQIFAKRENLVGGLTENVIKVDNAASQAVFVFKWTPASLAQPSFARLFRPDNSIVNPTLTAPGHLVWRVPAPEAGDWRMTFLPGNSPHIAHDFLTEASVISDLTLNVFLGLRPAERLAGRPMPIMALLSDLQTITGAAVIATVPRTGETLTLFDDGMHNDGAPNDGFYGGVILNTNQAGGYTVIVNADGTSPLAGPFVRRARVGFFMNGDLEDSDGDGIPTWWEKEHGTDPDEPNTRDDPDKDGLTTFQEYRRKTHPLDPDTDDGGEHDGSEVERGSNPRFPSDDIMNPPRAKAWPGVGKVYLKFTHSMQIAGVTAAEVVDIYGAIKRKPQEPFRLLASNVRIETGEWVDDIKTNWGRQPANTTFCYCVIAKSVGESAPSDVTCATPGSDPYPPHGEVEIKTPVAAAPTVTLLLSASDNPNTDEHLPFEGMLIDPEATQSGVKEMMISNRADFEGGKWLPYRRSYEWTPAFSENGRAHVFVKFRDAPGNESETVVASVHLMDIDRDDVYDGADRR